MRKGDKVTVTYGDVNKKEEKIDSEEVKKVMNMYAGGIYIEDIANYIGKSIQETNVIIDRYHSAFFY